MKGLGGGCSTKASLKGAPFSRGPEEALQEERGLLVATLLLTSPGLRGRGEQRRLPFIFVHLKDPGHSVCGVI